MIHKIVCLFPEDISYHSNPSLAVLSCAPPHLPSTLRAKSNRSQIPINVQSSALVNSGRILGSNTTCFKNCAQFLLMVSQKWCMFAGNVLCQRKKWCTTFNSVLQRAYSLGISPYGHYLWKYVILCTSIHSLFYNLFLMKAVRLKQIGTATIITLQTGNFHRFKASRSLSVLDVKYIEIRPMSFVFSL